MITLNKFNDSFCLKMLLFMQRRNGGSTLQVSNLRDEFKNAASIFEKKRISHSCLDNNL